MALRSGASSPRSVEVEENKFIPMDLAVKEADLRGSLLDRVAAIEDRLRQLCQEMESRGVWLSQSSVAQAFWDPISRNGSSQSQPCSVFRPSCHQDEPAPLLQLLEARSHKRQQKPRHEAAASKQDDTEKTGDRRRLAAGPKKLASCSWLLKKTLGC